VHYDGRLIDESETGIAIQIAIRLPIGAPVEVDDRAARIVRYLPEGLAIQYLG